MSAKEADVAVAGEIEFAFGVFVVVPEDVGGGDVDSAFFHFSEFAFPVFLRDAGEVDFAHFHDAGFAVAEDGVVGDGPAVAACRAGHVCRGEVGFGVVCFYKHLWYPFVFYLNYTTYCRFLQGFK